MGVTAIRQMRQVRRQRRPVLNVDAWNELCKAHDLPDSKEARSALIGVRRETLNRVLDGTRRPGGEFIHGVMTAFPSASYHRLFSTAKEDQLWAIPGHPIHARSS